MLLPVTGRLAQEVGKNKQAGPGEQLHPAEGAGEGGTTTTSATAFAMDELVPAHLSGAPNFLKVTPLKVAF